MIGLGYKGEDVFTALRNLLRENGGFFRIFPFVSKAIEDIQRAISKIAISM